jgi:hypothetical protein
MGFLRRNKKPRTSPFVSPFVSPLTSPVPSPSTPLPPGPAPATFTKMPVIRDALRELYRVLTPARVCSYTANIAPVFPAMTGADPVMGAQKLARSMALHLGMAQVRLIVSFRELGATGDGAYHAGNVELGPGPEYFITLSPRFRQDPRDTAAVLAHEVMHVFLYRNRVWWDDQDRNEILTDTATVYLGTGWLMLNAYRVERTRQSLGYLSPAELGYVLAKRAQVFDENIERYLADNPAARHAYQAGARRAAQDQDAAPLSGCAPAARRQYMKDKRRAAELTSTGVTGPAMPYAGGYRFEGHAPMTVVFACPTCHQRLRVPVDRAATIRCGTCRSTHACLT